MLKTYRIIPLVFILFLFGFTLITVSPVFAQSTKDLEDRIDIQQDLLCALTGKAGLERPYGYCTDSK